MKLSSITLYVIRMPLKVPFVTHLGTVETREAIIVEVSNEDGNNGYGECVAFSSPWYTEETISTCLHVLSDYLIPLLKNNAISHPNEAYPLFKGIRRNNMAKASLEMALWDLYAKQKGVPLGKLLGGTAKSIPAGVVAAAKNSEEALRQIAAYVKDGYQRVKVKISPENDYSLLKEIRTEFPKLPLMADANSSYSLKDCGKLKNLDQFNLLMIEQPLAHDDFIEHAELQRELMTPICLDESINSFSDAKMAVELGSCRVINIKAGKVGGLLEAKRIHDYCYEKGIAVWCGGMIEFGVSRAHTIALASLPGFSIPGDISASSRFWEEDIISPAVTVENGWIELPEGDGIGYEVNKKRLEDVTVEKRIFHFNA